MKLKIVFIALAFLLPTVLVHAQDGLTQCFDYYDFGSVQVDVRPLNKNILSGTNLVFTGDVKNTNNYPIVDGAVYVKIFKKEPKATNTSTGWEQLDQFFAKKDIAIDGRKQKAIEFTWKVPAYSVSGEYKAVTYFVTQDKYNLAGLSFTEDIAGNVIPFKVTSEQKKTVSFDRSTVKLNDETYTFGAFIPKVEKEGDVKLSFSLKNSNTITKNAIVTYTLYSWDGLTAEKQINTKKENIVLKAGEVKALSYTVTDTAHPVYYLVVESKVDDVKSIIDIRFARQGVEEARLNFPALANYPLKQGAPATMFSCFHNSGLGEKIDNGKVVMTLTDGKGKTVDTYTWEGAITGAMMAVKKEFTPTKDISNAILTTELYVNDKLVETSRTHYECSKINPEVCAAEAANAVGETSSTMMYIVIALALLVLIVAILAYHGHMKRKDVGVAALLFASTLGLGMYQVQAKMAEAKVGQEIYNDGKNGSLPISLPSNYVKDEYSYIGDKFRFKVSGLGSSNQVTSESGSVKSISGNNTDAYVNIDSFNFEYAYGAELQYADGTVIENGSEIPVNSVIKFVPTPLRNDNIVWHITGSTYDTPYAYWSGGSVPQCTQNDQVSYTVFNITQINGADGAHISGYLPIVVNKPNISIDVSKSTANLQANTSDGTYTVLTPGSISGDVNFAQTDANAYFQYKITYKSKTGVDFSGSCKLFNSHTFNLDNQTINLNAVVVGSGNLPPNEPTFTLTGACQNLDVDGKIKPATVPDPNVGDTIIYQYMVDYGSGYGPEQNLLGTDFSVIFTTTGVKKISVRAVDQGGLTSAWVEKIKTINNCDSISVYCYDPVFVGPSSNSPQYNVKSFSSNTSLTYNYTWTWPSTSFSKSNTNGTDDDTVTGSSMNPGETRTGPTVVMTASNGSTQTYNCPNATLGGGSTNPGTPLIVDCRIDTVDDSFIPSWKIAKVTGGNGTYTYTWSGLDGVGSGAKFTAADPIPDNTTISTLKVNAQDSTGRTSGDISCESITRGVPKIDIQLKDKAGNYSTKLKVVKGSPVDSFATYSGVSNTCIYSPHLTSKLINPLLSTSAGPSQLVNHDIDTSVTGKFSFFLQCASTADSSQYISSNRAQLEVVNNPNLEEI